MLAKIYLEHIAAKEAKRVFADDSGEEELGLWFELGRFVNDSSWQVRNEKFLLLDKIPMDPIPSITSLTHPHHHTHLHIQ